MRSPGPPCTLRRGLAVALLVLLVGGLALVNRSGGRLGAASGAAGADETTLVGDPVTDPSTTTPPTSTPDDSSTTVATDPSTTDGSSTSSSSSSSTSSTTADPTDTTLPAGDGSEQDVGSSFGPQAPFDPASRLALPAAIAQARHEKAAADRDLVQAQAALARGQSAQAGVSVELSGLSPADRTRFERARAAREALIEEAVAVYVQGGAASSVDLLGSASPSDLSTGMEMLDSVLDHLSRQSRQYEAARAAVPVAQRKQVDQAATVAQDLASLQDGVDTATRVDQAAAWQLLTFQNASHVWVPGFTFPVEGPTRFVDSFGDARASGTSEAHWHEGCDVMAATGTPLVAVEDGVLTSYGGSDPLGGLSLFLRGTSGYSYYYAHLSAFAPGLVQGDTVTAGALIGFVGSTGDALAPHVHFEIHDPDGQVLDSYGLLKTAWSARQAALGLPPGDPAQPPLDVDPATPGGFPRAPDASPVVVGPVIDPYPST
jgi:murein DD-endopeptidase MepM/ murein hydrolase activator NlpD